MRDSRRHRTHRVVTSLLVGIALCIVLPPASHAQGSAFSIRVSEDLVSTSFVGAGSGGGFKSDNSEVWADFGFNREIAVIDLTQPIDPADPTLSETVRLTGTGGNANEGGGLCHARTKFFQPLAFGTPIAAWDEATRSQTATLDIPIHQGPGGPTESKCYASPDGKTVAVTSITTANISLIDNSGAVPKFKKNIVLGAGRSGYDIAFSNDSLNVYAIIQTDNGPGTALAVGNNPAVTPTTVLPLADENASLVGLPGTNFVGSSVFTRGVDDSVIVHIGTSPASFQRRSRDGMTLLASGEAPDSNAADYSSDYGRFAIGTTGRVYDISGDLPVFVDDVHTLASTSQFHDVQFSDDRRMAVLTINPSTDNTDNNTDNSFRVVVVSGFPGNNPAFFIPGSGQVVDEDAGLVSVPGWATGFGAGVTFVVTNDNNALFAVQPAVASDGTLTFTLAANANGTATVTVIAQTIDGATYTKTFTITIRPDSPTITGVSPATILQHETKDITISGDRFDPGATADFGAATKVAFVTFVNQQTLVARVSGLSPGVDEEPVAYQVTVLNPDGGHFTTTPIFMVVPDTDGDGVADAQDNCPNDFNPSQTTSGCPEVIPPQPVTLGEGDGTATTSTTNPASGEPVYHQACVTFPGQGTPYWFAPPNARTIHLEAFVVTTGGDLMVLDRRVPEDIILDIPDGLEFNDGTRDIERCFVVDLTQQFAFSSGETVQIDTEYQNFAQPEAADQLTDPTSGTPSALLITKLDLGTTTTFVQSGDPVQTVGGTLAVNPQFWSTLWETRPTTGMAVFSMSSLTGGATLDQIVLSSLLFEGSLTPTTTDVFVELRVNKTELLRALRKRIGHRFADNDVERVQLTGRLTDGRVLKTGVDITLQDPVEQINALIDKIQASTIDSTTKGQLIDRLIVAREHIKAGHSSGACTPLQQVIQTIKNQSGKKIPASLATGWLADATRIRNVLLECK